MQRHPALSRNSYLVPCSNFWLSRFEVCAQPRGESGFIESVCRQAEHGLRGCFLAGREIMAVDFQEQHADDEAGALVAVEKWMVADDAGGVGGGQRGKVRIVAVGLQLLRSRERELQQAAVAQAAETSVERQQPAVDREGVALVNPNWRTPRTHRTPAPLGSHALAHFASTCSVFR